MLASIEHALTLKARISCRANLCPKDTTRCVIVQSTDQQNVYESLVDRMRKTKLQELFVSL